MKTSRRWVIPALRLYAVAGFVVAVVFSPPALSFIPGLLALAYIFLWWRLPVPVVSLLADLFSFYGIAVLLSQVLNPYIAALLGLPLLILITHDLETYARTKAPAINKQSRFSPTGTGWALCVIAGAILVFGMLTGNIVTMVLSAVNIIYVGTLLAISRLRIPRVPVEIEPVHERIVAGTFTSSRVAVNAKSRLGLVVLRSPYDWFAVNPDTFNFEGLEFNLQISVTPPLSGPGSVTLQAAATDRWGLTQRQFEVVPLTMHVIPRARYAEWLARRYLTESKTGTLPLISNISAAHPLYGLRVGIEYYGSQLYQPGDSLKNIDWKHSIKYGELISKEFAEFRGQPAVLLVNLTVASEDEADRQAYNLVVAALSLAREQIPTAIAAYDDDDVYSVTTTLPPADLIMRALELSQQIKVTGSPLKYLQKPDVVRLRANIQRLKSVDMAAARTLSELLQAEYTNLKDNARSNPATRALAMVSGRTGMPQFTIVIISPLNHDAEAVMLLAAGYSAKGNTAIIVEEKPARPANGR